MHSYSLIAPAKINLHLEIIGDRPDGYHELVMILQTIDLVDRIELNRYSKDKIILYCDHPEVPLDESNLAYQAAALMEQEFPEASAKYGGIKITIDKQIPVAAGLAGGSSDAAAVLVGMNQMWKLGLTKPELESLAAKLGSDVPFCLSGGTAIATGRGEKLDPIQYPDGLWAVLAKDRHLSVSTAWAYQSYHKKFGSEYVSDPDTVLYRTSEVHSGPLVGAIMHQDLLEIGQLLRNDLEKVVLPEFPEVAELRAAFSDAGVLGTTMSGSGPTVFALCESEIEARRVERRVRESIANPRLDFWVVKLSSSGIQIVSS